MISEMSRKNHHMKASSKPLLSRAVSKRAEGLRGSEFQESEKILRNRKDFSRITSLGHH